MKPAYVLTGIAVLLVGMVAAVVFKGLSADAQPGRSGGERAIPVRATDIRTHAFADIVEAVGTLRAEESVAITASVAETVTSVNFDSGSMIEKGAVLLTLADAEERAALAEAEAALEEARSDAQRLEQLSRNDAVSRSALDQARSALQRSRAQRNAVRARLDEHVIRAPFGGRIGLREVSVGAYVRPGDVLLTLDQLDNVDVDFTVPERFLAVLEPGLPVRATAAAYPDDAFEGSIADIDSRVDPVTRAVTVRARLPNGQGRLRPGMLLSVDIRRDEREAPAVPEIAVMRNGEQVSVFAIESSDEGPRAVRREIRIGARDGRLIEVLDGLQPGDRIIQEGVHRASDGSLLDIRNSADDGQARLRPPQNRSIAVVPAVLTAAIAASSRPAGSRSVRSRA